MESLLTPETIWLLALVTLWSLPWKGYALWKAAGRRERGWFIVLFIVNSAAILEIIYLFFVIPRKNQNKE